MYGVHTLLRAFPGPLAVGRGKLDIDLTPGLCGQMDLGVIGAQVGVAAHIRGRGGRGVDEAVVSRHFLLARGEEAATAAMVIAMPCNEKKKMSYVGSSYF